MQSYGLVSRGQSIGRVAINRVHLLSLVVRLTNEIPNRSATTKASNTKMKRKAFDEIAKAKPKVQHVRAPEPDYCDVEPRKDGDEIVWPAPSDAMEKARTFIQEW